MARPIDRTTGTAPATVDERRLARSTARAFAAAFAGLLVTSVVVQQSRSATEPEGTGATTAFDAATIALHDDDEGRSLVQLDDMVPGRPQSACIEVRYEGTVLPATVSLAADSNGTLASMLDIVVERGSGATFGDCNGFVSDATVYRGTLDGLRDAVQVATIVADDSALSFRFRFDVADRAEAIGARAGADFRWEVRPG